MIKKIVLVLMLVICGVALAQARFMKTYKLTASTSPTTITLYQVKGLYIYSDEVNYLVSFSGGDYIPMAKGGAFNFSGIDMASISFSVKTGSGSGTVYYIVQK